MSARYLFINESALYQFIRQFNVHHEERYTLDLKYQNVLLKLLRELSEPGNGTNCPPDKDVEISDPHWMELCSEIQDLVFDSFDQTLGLVFFLQRSIGAGIFTGQLVQSLEVFAQ